MSKTYRSEARKLWRKAEWIMGEGRWAVLAHCQVLTVTLWPTQEGAEQAKRQIDHAYCGSRCVGNHEVVDIGQLKEAAR